MRLGDDFFRRDAREVAPELAGKLLACKTAQGVSALRIAETEIYLGEADTACHAHKGRTSRTDALYRSGGTIYVYLCYGMHWLINIVTAEEENPQCVLIRVPFHLAQYPDPVIPGGAAPTMQPRNICKSTVHAHSFPGGALLAEVKTPVERVV